MRSALAGHIDQVRRDQRALITAAWQNACWSSFSPQLLPLAEVLRQLEGREEDPDVAWHRMKVWAAAYGQVIEEE